MSGTAYSRNKSAFESFSYVRELKALSRRDREWLTRLSHGYCVKELEGRSEQSIKNRLQSIRQFLKVKNTTEAVAESIRRGIIK
jgi:DNA-binding NarL/FixJ family response regulator